MASVSRKKIVVVGLGMVGISFIEKILKLDARTREYDITVIGEESHLAYNRVGLTSFFEHRKVDQLYLNPLSWYEAQVGTDNALGWHLNQKVLAINKTRKTVTCADGNEVPYDILVLATGSDALLPRHTPGYDAKGVFVYRTIEDLERLIDFSATRRGTDGAVIGGGLLGLEAAKAMMDLAAFRQVKVIERNRWVLSRQLDSEAGNMVVEQVRALGVDVMVSRRVAKIDTHEDGDGSVRGVYFEDGEYMACSTLCFAIGVRPRDELAREAGIACADNTGGGGGGGGGGGIVVGDDLRTSEQDIYAIGECASWNGQTFGLIAPGVEMADVLSFNLTQGKLHAPRAYKRPDLSTKLKLLGVEVASFGDFFADRDGPKYLPARAEARRKRSGGGNDKETNGIKNREMNGKPNNNVELLADGPPPPTVKALTYKDPFQNVYKKYIFTVDGKYLLGGMMIGDTRDYIKLVPLVKNQKPLETAPSELILGASKNGVNDDDGANDLDDDTQICSCHNVNKGDIVHAVRDGTCSSIGEIKSCTKAGTGCGGCMPLVTSIFNKTMADMGNEVKNNICPHFSYSRAELYHIIMVKRLQTFPQVMQEAGVHHGDNDDDDDNDNKNNKNNKNSVGCEVCKPAVASCLASLWNKHVMSPAHHGLQDTNDRWLGNIQRNGTFSVVPRVPGGEITPERLIVIGEVAKQYGLYTKITGGQRIDMFGAQKQDLLAIWKTLVDAGMESGHAYAKSLRTVKSCVGTTWCRFGVGDSVGMAVRLEERYKSIRSPHKIKGGVSGCVRECAEAQNKDFGLIATEKGFNIFVAGNGGAKPKHSELLAKDVPPTEVIPILDRYLMFYIQTADRLQRTARWLEALPGGIQYLREVILADRLGLNAALEAQMAELVDSYFDEWAEAVRDPVIAARFRQFHNTDETVQGMEVERNHQGQTLPVPWSPDPAPSGIFQALRARWATTLTWQPVIEASHFAGADTLPNGISASIKRGDTQLAVWRIRGRYYATQQMCPHKRAFILSDGLVGQDDDVRDEKKEKDDIGQKNGGNNTPGNNIASTATAAPWISCPHHKRNYDLSNGNCKNDSEVSIVTFEVEERSDGFVYLKLPPVEELDAELGTSRWKVKKGEGRNQLEELDRKIQFVGQRAKKIGVRPHTELSMKKPVELIVAGGGCGGPGLDW